MTTAGMTVGVGHRGDTALLPPTYVRTTFAVVMVRVPPDCFEEKVGTSRFPFY